MDYNFEVLEMNGNSKNRPKEKFLFHYGEDCIEVLQANWSPILLYPCDYQKLPNNGEWIALYTISKWEHENHFQKYRIKHFQIMCNWKQFSLYMLANSLIESGLTPKGITNSSGNVTRKTFIGEMASFYHDKYYDFIKDSDIYLEKFFTIDLYNDTIFGCHEGTWKDFKEFAKSHINIMINMF